MERRRWQITFSGEREFDVSDLEFDEGQAVIAEVIESDPLKFLADLEEECDMEITMEGPKTEEEETE